MSFSTIAKTFLWCVLISCHIFYLTKHKKDTQYNIVTLQCTLTNGVPTNCKEWAARTKTMKDCIQETDYHNRHTRVGVPTSEPPFENPGFVFCEKDNGRKIAKSDQDLYEALRVLPDESPNHPRGQPQMKVVEKSKEIEL